MVQEFGYTWSELADELLGDVLYTYATWERQKHNEKKKQEEAERKAP